MRSPIRPVSHRMQAVKYTRSTKYTYLSFAVHKAVSEHLLALRNVRPATPNDIIVFMYARLMASFSGSGSVNRMALPILKVHRHSRGAFSFRLFTSKRIH